MRKEPELKLNKAEESDLAEFIEKVQDGQYTNHKPQKVKASRIVFYRIGEEDDNKYRTLTTIC